MKSADVGALNLNESGISGVPEQNESWTYDETGNWLAYEKDEDGTTSIDQSRRHNESNQITVIDGESSGVAHDLNGNATLLPTGVGLQDQSRKLIWNPWNKLVEVLNASDNALIGKYVYDGRFRRTTVTDVASKDASSSPLNVYYWGAQSRWELMRRDRDTTENGTLDESLYCLKDAMDPIAVVDSSGTVQERYEYTAFGNVSFFDSGYTSRSASNYDWTFLFHREFWDVESGYYNYGFRYYDPETGRWPSRDLIEEEGGRNVYQSMENDGLNRLDNLGLLPTLEAIPHSMATRENPYVGDCGLATWVIEWKIGGKAADFLFGGQIIQDVEIRTDITDCSGLPWYNEARGEPIPHLRTYTESWRVLPSSFTVNGLEDLTPGALGISQNDFDRRKNADIFGSDEELISEQCQQPSKGTITTVGYARYYPVQGPVNWPRGRSGAELLRSTTINPDWDKPGTSNLVKRSFKVRWDCCNGNQKTEIVYQKITSIANPHN